LLFTCKTDLKMSAKASQHSKSAAGKANSKGSRKFQASLQKCKKGEERTEAARVRTETEKKFCLMKFLEFIFRAVLIILNRDVKPPQTYTKEEWLDVIDAAIVEENDKRREKGYPPQVVSIKERGDFLDASHAIWGSQWELTHDEREDGTWERKTPKVFLCKEKQKPPATVPFLQIPTGERWAAALHPGEWGTPVTEEGDATKLYKVGVFLPNGDLPTHAGRLVKWLESMRKDGVVVSLRKKHTRTFVLVDLSKCPCGGHLAALLDHLKDIKNLKGYNMYNIGPWHDNVQAKATATAPRKESNPFAALKPDDDGEDDATDDDGAAAPDEVNDDASAAAGKDDDAAAATDEVNDDEVNDDDGEDDDGEDDATDDDGAAAPDEVNDDAAAAPATSYATRAAMPPPKKVEQPVPPKKVDQPVLAKSGKIDKSKFYTFEGTVPGDDGDRGRGRGYDGGRGRGRGRGRGQGGRRDLTLVDVARVFLG
jgi:hypothetical protein